MIVEDNASVFIKHGTGITSHDKDRDLTIRDNALFVTEFIDFTAKDLNGNTGSDAGKKCRVNLDGGKLRTSEVRMASQSEFNWRGGTIEPGNISGPKMLIFQGDLNASNEKSTLSVEVVDKNTFGKLDVNGTLHLGNGVLDLDLESLKEFQPVSGIITEVVKADQILGKFNVHDAGALLNEVSSVQDLVLNTFYVEYNSSSINIHYYLDALWQNSGPADLNSSMPLIIFENQSSGFMIGKFNATDSDANDTLTFSLVDGNGSDGNSYFHLDHNGLFDLQ